MLIRRAGADKIKEILRVERCSFNCCWAESQYIAGLDRGTLRLLIAENDETVTGYIAFTVMAGEMEILNIAVLHEFRRQGAGEELLCSALKEGVTDGAEECFLDVRVSNKPAIRLYTKLGFEQVGKRKRYYPDNREDALLFCLDLKE